MTIRVVFVARDPKQLPILDFGQHATQCWVTAHRAHSSDYTWLAKTRDECFRCADQHKHGVANLSVVPDHLHLALRGHYTQSPEEIALNYLNNLALIHGQQAVWQNGYYVGTFSEYNMNAIRIKPSPDLGQGDATPAHSVRDEAAHSNSISTPPDPNGLARW